MRINIRKVMPADLNFILDSWLKSWRISRYSGTIPNNLYFPTQRATIEGLIGRGAIFLVASPEGQDEVILGWACGETKEDKTVLHYVYVKDPYLEKGIESDLVEALPGAKPGFITHNQQRKEHKEWKWLPEMARRKSL